MTRDEAEYKQQFKNSPHTFQGRTTTETVGELFQNKAALDKYVDINWQYDLADYENRVPKVSEEDQQFVKTYDRYLDTYLLDQEAVDKAKAEVSTTEGFEADYYYPPREYEEEPFSILRKYVADPASDLFEAGKYYTGRAFQKRQLEHYNNPTLLQRNSVEVEDLARRGINPNKYYSFRFSDLPTDQRSSDSLESLIEDLEGKRLTGSDEAERRQTLQGLRLQQQKLNRENLAGPTIRRFFQAAVMTPREAKFFLKDISPNAEVRYIDPKDPTRGVAVRDENTNGMYEPLDPQFGTAFLSEELLNFAGQEASTILLEVAGLKGLDKVLGKPIENTSIGRKLLRGVSNVGNASLAAGVGRLAQLALGERLGYNNITFERAYEDAFSSAVWAGVGTAAIGSSLSLIGTTWKVITGKAIPDEILLDIGRRIRDAEKIGTGEEFTTEQLQKRLKEVVGSSYSPSAGELTSDAEINNLILSLQSQLLGDNKGAQALDELTKENSDLAIDFWNELTKKDPAWEGIGFANFRKYLDIEEQKNLEIEQRLLTQQKEAVEREIGGELDKLTLVTGDEEELARRVLTTVDRGGLIYDYASGTMLDSFDSRLGAATAAINKAFKELSEGDEDTGIVPIKGYANLNKNQIYAQYEKFLFPAFRKLFGADEEIIDAIARFPGDVETSRLVRDMIPMKDGLSIIGQLTGKRVDDDGKLLPLPSYTFGQLTSLVDALNELYLSNSKPAVRTAVNELRTAVSSQIDDLLMHEAKQRLKNRGNPSPTASAVRQEIDDIIMPLTRAKEELAEVRNGIERQYLKDLTSKKPEEIAGFILKSSPRQVRQLVDELHQLDDSTSHLQAVRELVLLTIREAIGKDGIENQAKNFDKFLNANSRQLSELFGENFDNLRNFNELQENALNRIDELNKAGQELEARFGLDQRNFIKEILFEGKLETIAGNQLKKEEFQELMERYPDLRPVVIAITKDAFRKRFMGTRYTDFESEGYKKQKRIFAGGKAGFDLESFIDFVNKGRTQEDLASVFIPLFGEEVGKQYAKDLRMFSQLMQRSLKPEKGRKDVPGSSPVGVLDSIFSYLAFTTRMVIPPLTREGRQLNALSGAWRTSTKKHILEILSDPAKLNKLIKSRSRNLTIKQYVTFISALAETRWDVSEERLEEEDLAELEAMLDEN